MSSISLFVFYFRYYQDGVLRMECIVSWSCSNLFISVPFSSTHPTSASRTSYIRYCLSWPTTLSFLPNNLFSFWPWTASVLASNRFNFSWHAYHAVIKVIKNITVFSLHKSTQPDHTESFLYFYVKVNICTAQVIVFIHVYVCI